MSLCRLSGETLTLTPPGEKVELELPKPAKLQQVPLSVTLDGTAIFGIAICLALLVHFSEAHVAEVLIVLAPFIVFIYHDYQNYLNLGPGGTPSTFRGYLRISWLHLWALRDPFRAPGPQANFVPQRGILNRQPLPYRAGPRPWVVGIAPQRQIDQSGSYQSYQGVRLAMEALSLRCPEKFGTARSCIEKHGLALFARHPLRTRCQGEVCHVHDSEYSMHMAMHPDDIKEVLAKGWGQRHPLGWEWRFITMPVSPHFVMVYAPRDDQELRVTYRIIQAAIWYTLGEDVSVEAYLKSV